MVTADILERHFTPSILMLEAVISNCPEPLWRKAGNHAPLWQHVMHTIEGVDYFLTDGELPYLSEPYKRHIPFDFSETDLEYIDPAACQVYYQKIKHKCERYLSAYKDRLMEKSMRPDHYTILDILLAQIRHIQYHVAYCSSILARYGEPDIAWLGFGE
jgi:hypothetical protein